MQPADGETTYTLPELVWKDLSSAEKLFYRVVTASSNSSSWLNYQTSLADEKATDAPSIQLVDRIKSRLTVASHQNDEGLWRT